MGEVVSFRPKRLSGFIPDQPDATAPPPKHNLTEPIVDDRACSETNPDSGDCV